MYILGMGRKITFMILPLASIFIMVLLLAPLAPLSFAAACPGSMTEVDASLSPEHDANNNGLICQYVRSAIGFPTVTVYQDDVILWK